MPPALRLSITGHSATGYTTVHLAPVQRSRYLRLLGLLEGKVGVADAADMVLGEFAILLAEVLGHRFEPLRGVNELSVRGGALACGW